MKILISFQLGKVHSEENQAFDLFQNGFDTEADPIISINKQRSTSPEVRRSPQIVRRSIGSSPECSSDLGLEKKRDKKDIFFLIFLIF